jgi:uncharacterized protein YqeY
MIKEIVREKMITAMKAKDEKQKAVYKYLLDQLMKAEKAKQTATNPNPALSEAEEVAVVQSLIKQTRGAIDKTLSEAAKNSVKDKEADLNAFVADREFELKLYSEFVPAEMTAEEIQKVIEETVATLPAPVNKGMLMKNLMPKVKGKADGKLVSTMVEEYLKLLNDNLTVDKTI